MQQMLQANSVMAPNKHTLHNQKCWHFWLCKVCFMFRAITLESVSEAFAALLIASDDV